MEYSKKYSYIADDKLLKKYFRRRDLAEGSIVKYTYTMQLYRHITGLTPTEAIDEADQDEEDGIRLRRRSIVQHLEDFEDFLDQNYSENTLKSCMAFIRSFYRFNEITELPNSQRRKFDKNKQYAANVKKLPGADHIKKAMSFSSIKYQAIIMLLASSGMRQGDLRRLKLWQLTEAIKWYVEIDLDDLNNIPQTKKKIKGKIGPLWWDFYMKKGRRCHTTFSSPEATRAIVEYLDTDPPQSPDDFLFRSGGKQIQDGTADEYVKFINHKLGISKEYKHKRINTRNFRKRFASFLMMAEINYRQAEYMLGHVLPPTQGSYYYLLDEESMRIAYLKALPYLMILEPMETKVLTSEDKAEFEAMKKRERLRVEEDRKREEREKEKDNLIEVMNSRLEALERREERKEWIKENIKD